jgi:hypothetical protein
VAVMRKIEVSDNRRHSRQTSAEILSISFNFSTSKI